ncbi:MAG: hypothetical protein J2P18_05305 [Nocardia sp.]|nr:hypothetical protein [Nocardia sp.]
MNDHLPSRFARPSAPRILVLDPIPGYAGLDELEELTRLGLTPTVNTRRVADAELRAALRIRWDCIDIDAFDAHSLGAVVERAEGFDALKCRAGIPLTRPLLRRISDRSLRQPLRLIAKAASGTDSIDLRAAQEFGVTVVSTPGANAHAVAELTIGLMLEALRRIRHRDLALRSHDWTAAVAAIPARSLAQSQVGLIGTGATARKVATLLAAFGTEVLVHGSPRFTAERAAGWPARRVASLTELLAGCDIISVHVPSTPETTGLIGPAELRCVKPGAILINTSRADIVPEQAIDAALRNPECGLSYAAVDVFHSEGPGFDSSLTANPATTLSPHVAGMTWDAMTTASHRLLEQIAHFYRADVPRPGRDRT